MSFCIYSSSDSVVVTSGTGTATGAGGFTGPVAFLALLPPTTIPESLSAPFELPSSSRSSFF